MEPQGRGNVPALHTPERNKQLGLRKTTLESRGHVQTVGLNAETTTCRHRAEGEECLLTFPFIGRASEAPRRGRAHKTPGVQGETTLLCPNCRRTLSKCFGSPRLRPTGAPGSA